MSQLIDLIDGWRDRHGRPSEASESRAISNSDKTVNAWRKRGIKAMPDAETLRKLAVLLNVPDEVVVLAAAADAGYLEPGRDRSEDAGSAKTADVRRANEA